MPSAIKRSSLSIKCLLLLLYHQKNIAIECQGKQHFGIGGWTDKYDFDLQLKRDEVKYNLCKKQGIYLIRIKYKNNRKYVKNWY